MGKQVRFYMTSNDETAFVDFIRKDRCVCFLSESMPDSSLSCLEQLLNKGTPKWFCLWLWDKDNSPRPSLDHFPATGTYSVDMFASEVIEFQRSMIENSTLTAGRIWAEFSYFDECNPERMRMKNDVFLRWFERLASWIRRNGVRDHGGHYVLPGARKCKVLTDSLEVHPKAP